jgi:Zn finger protein HypA/HybF involved in hydrogenase expression
MLETKKFKRNQEDFKCEHCGHEVKGNGYTNHCPACLWSKHVDVNPGDRAATCGGMMKPIMVEMEKQEYILTHECEKCGHSKRNKMSLDDDFDVATTIANRNGLRGE